MLIEEYQRRLTQTELPGSLESERKQVALALKRAMAQEDRITDAYINEVMKLDRYKEEMDRLRARRQELECVARGIARREREELDSRAAREHLERFCLQVSKGLEAMTFEECQHLLRLLVERITVEDGHVRIETAIPTTGEESVQLRARHQGERTKAAHGELVEPCTPEVHFHISWCL